MRAPVPLSLPFRPSAGEVAIPSGCLLKSGIVGARLTEAECCLRETAQQTSSWSDMDFSPLVGSAIEGRFGQGQRVAPAGFPPVKRVFEHLVLPNSGKLADLTVFEDNSVLVGIDAAPIRNAIGLLPFALMLDPQVEHLEVRRVLSSTRQSPEPLRRKILSDMESWVAMVRHLKPVLLLNQGRAVHEPDPDKTYVPPWTDSQSLLKDDAVFLTGLLACLCHIQRETHPDILTRPMQISLRGRRLDRAGRAGSMSIRIDIANPSHTDGTSGLIAGVKRLLARILDHPEFPVPIRRQLCISYRRSHDRFMATPQVVLTANETDLGRMSGHEVLRAMASARFWIDRLGSGH